jgi:hypothetical protein
MVSVALAFLYWAFRCLLELLALRLRSERSKEIEILVLLKGANIGVITCWCGGWEDRRHGLLVSLPRGAGFARCACA